MNENEKRENKFINRFLLRRNDKQGWKLLIKQQRKLLVMLTKEASVIKVSCHADEGSIRH